MLEAAQLRLCGFPVPSMVPQVGSPYILEWGPKKNCVCSKKTSGVGPSFSIPDPALQIMHKIRG